MKSSTKSYNQNLWYTPSSWNIHKLNYSRYISFVYTFLVNELKFKAEYNARSIEAFNTQAIT